MTLFMVSKIYHQGKVQAKAGEWYDLKEDRGKEYELFFREGTQVPDDTKTLLYVRNAFQFVFTNYYIIKPIYSILLYKTKIRKP